VLFEETAAHGLESVLCNFAKVSAHVCLCSKLNGELTFENFFEEAAGHGLRSVLSYFANASAKVI